MFLTACLDSRSRRKQNREQYPPERMFTDVQLDAAKSMYNGNLAKMEETLRAHPAQINQLSPQGYTLLMYAAIIEDLPAMEKLLELKANPDIITPFQGLNDTPVNQAVATNNYEMLKLLLKYKASLNPALGKSPLVVAMTLGDAATERKMIDFLLEHGADVNHQAINGDNILEAAATDDLELSEYLLAKGAQPMIPGTTLVPVAGFVEWKESQLKKAKKADADYQSRLQAFKQKLQQDYKVSFPVRKDPVQEAQHYIRLYEKLNPADKTTINFDNNYGQNRYEESRRLLAQ